MKFLILTNTLSERADSVNTIELVYIIRDYMLKDCAVAISDRHLPNENRVRQLLNLDVPLHVYSSKLDLEKFAKSENTTHTIAFSGGGKAALDYAAGTGDFRINDNFHITQVVFKSRDVHGELYLYVSKWLMGASRPPRKEQTLVDFLPHSLDPNPIFGELPSFLSEIKNSSHVVSRIGGYTQFDDKAAQRGVVNFLEQNHDSAFIAVNTKPFSDHPRITYTPPLDRPQVWSVLQASKAVVNGRRMGESFGYSIFEPLLLGKPVIAPHWLRNPLMDKNHIETLRSHDLLFKSRDEVSAKLSELVHTEWSIPKDLQLVVSESSRSNVAKKLSSLISKSERR